jgi:hypothetical protein
MSRRYHKQVPGDFILTVMLDEAEREAYATHTQLGITRRMHHQDVIDIRPAITYFENEFRQLAETRHNVRELRRFRRTAYFKEHPNARRFQATV